MKDEELLKNIGLAKGGKIYFRDLGPQVGWTTVSQRPGFIDYVVVWWMLIAVMCLHISFCMAKTF